MILHFGLLMVDFMKQQWGYNMKYKVFTTREFEKILKQNNYLKIRTKGDHMIFEHTETKNKITINANINPMVCRRLIKENNLIC